jgi:hypothetical protein
VNHDGVRNSLADYLEGDLGLDARAAVDAHLDGCEECTREVAEMQQTIRLLRMLPEPETPPMIAANVMRRIRAGETEPKGLSRIFRGIKSIFEPSFVLPASAIAAAALVVVVLQDPQAVRLPSFLNPGAGPEVPSAEFATAQGGSGTAQATRAAGLDSVVPGVISRADPRSASAAAEPTRPAGPSRRRIAEATPRSHGNLVQRPASSPGTVSGRTVYADPMLAPPTPRIPRTTVPDVYVSDDTRHFVGNRAGDGVNFPPSTTFVVDGMGNNLEGARAVAQSARLDSPRSRSANDVRFSLSEIGRSGMSSGGEDPRDAWLARGLSDPVGFSHFIAEQNLAEQELWVSRLSERAESRGLLLELTETLRRTGDPTASWLAADFEAEVERSRGESESSEEPAIR